jgi:hypothetical protein
LDLADGDATRVLFARLGRFDHLVFTAGETLQLGSLATTDLDAARRFFALRYWGAYCAAKYGSSRIGEGGSIVFTSGIAGQRPHAGWALGASICAAMEGLTRALAVELAPVRVNIVSPGVVRTPLWANMAEADRGALYQQTAERLPVGHVGDATEIAEAYLYLMRQSYCTGKCCRRWRCGPGLSSRSSQKHVIPLNQPRRPTMEILRRALVKHRFSWPVMGARPFLSIAITAAPALGQASGDQTPRSHSERKSVMTMKNDLANRSLDINWPKGSLCGVRVVFTQRASRQRIVRAGLEAYRRGDQVARMVSQLKECPNPWRPRLSPQERKRFPLDDV